MSDTAKILIYDIEASGLEADWDTALCLGYSWYGSDKVSCISLLDTNKKCAECGRIDTLSDAALMGKMREILLQADVLVSWYGREGRGFDSRFINARMLAADLPAMPLMTQIDLHVLARDRFKFSSNRLANVQRFLKLNEVKTPLEADIWQKARVGDVKSLKYVMDHCRQDIKVLRDAYTILRPWVVNHPRILQGDRVCPVCGQSTLVIERYKVSRAMGKRVTMRCTRCGAYDTRAASKEVKDGK